MTMVQPLRDTPNLEAQISKQERKGTEVSSCNEVYVHVKGIYNSDFM